MIFLLMKIRHHDCNHEAWVEEQRAAAIDLVNTVSSQAIELEKLREQLLAERKRAENAEAKCTAILNVLTE